MLLLWLSSKKQTPGVLNDASVLQGSTSFRRSFCAPSHCSLVAKRKLNDFFPCLIVLNHSQKPGALLSEIHGFLSCAYWFDVSPAPESYDSSGNQSFEIGGCLFLFRPPSFMFCCSVYVLGRCLVQTGSQWGVEKGKKNDVSLLYSEVFAFGSAGRNKNIRSLIVHWVVSLVISPLLLMKLLEGMLSYFYITFLSLCIR